MALPSVVEVVVVVAFPELLTRRKINRILIQFLDLCKVVVNAVRREVQIVALRINTVIRG
jgi:hypothetical protein